MRDRVAGLLRRIRQVEHREMRDARRWLERTSTLVHLSVLLVVPLLMALVTALANAVGELSFLLYPPLASGAYTLFADPEGRYASPIRFVGGLTVGATCGWVSVEFAVRTLYATPPGEINAVGAALAVFLTGAVTWALDVEEPSAYATALLTLFVYGRIETPAVFVLSVAVSSAIVAGAFAGWRSLVYERRAEYLYESTSGDDHVLVPMAGPPAEATAMLGARIAAAHRAGKVVLLDVVDDEGVARAERTLLEEHDDTRLLDPGGIVDGGRIGSDRGDAAGPGEGGHGGSASDGDDSSGLGARQDVAEAVADLERRARNVETKVGVPCEVVVTTRGPSRAKTVLRTAREANCDLVAVPYESKHGSVTAFVRELFRGDVDVLVHHSHDGRTRWQRILVPVRRASDVAHSMLDFATRLARRTGEISVGTCVASDRERRRGEQMLADLVEPFDGTIETRVSRQGIETFLVEHAAAYDLVIVGASQDRSAASRFISPPTFERIDNDELGTDVAIVDRH
jgi:nucleotide-binding universal stress UspA family protein